MQYPLSSVHKLIYETIHPDTISKEDAVTLPEETWRQAKQEIEDSRLHLFSQLSQASGTDSLKVTVYTCQAGYIGLIRRLGSYISQMKPGEKPAAGGCLIANQYKHIRKLLVDDLLRLYHEYYPFFDPEQPVPNCILNSKPYRLNARLAAITEQIPELCDDPALTLIVCTSLAQMPARELPDMTYRRFHYLRQFVAALNRYCFGAKPFADCQAFTDFLIRKNFNEPAFIEHIMKQLRGQITEDMTLPEQAEKWAFHIKEFQQIILTTPHALYPQRQTVKECLIHAAEQELGFLKEKMALLPLVHTPAALCTKEKRSVMTELTVSQLGVLMRLLTDCKLVLHPNQTELLKLVAGCLATTKTAQISAESLRVRYYNPDRASVAIVKEYLLRMLKQAGQY